MHTLLGCLAFVVAIATVRGQSVEPKVTITHTDPESEGERVKGIITTDVLLTCYVLDKPDQLQVRWQRTMFDKDGKETTQLISTDMAVEDNSKWSIEKPTQYSWRLRIKSLSVPDEGNYTCFVRLTGNDNRVEANRTVLSYSSPIIIEEQSSSDTTVKEGDFVPLRCNATGRPTPNIIWRRQGNAILPGGGVRHMGSSLDVYDIEYTAQGLYICEALNDVGMDRRDVTLTITHSPQMFPDPDRVGQAVGYQRTLTCHIAANPVPSTNFEDSQVWWTKDNERLLPSSDRWETRSLVGAYSRLTIELVFYRVADENYGIYYCHASTNLGQSYGEVELYETNEPQNDKKNSVSGASGLLTSVAAILFCAILSVFHLDT